MKHLRLPLILLLAAVLAGVGLWLLWPRHEAGAPGVSPRAAPAGRDGRPNVVLISLDTVRPDHLGVYGYAKPTSPRLDAFARDAVVFTQARAQAPWTLPSHASLFTSLLPSHARVEDINQRLPDDVTTLAAQLAGAGYRTAALVNDGQMKAHWGLNRGFAEWREFPVDTPAGACDAITREALAWLARAPAADTPPFFLFLHYFDAHDPYEAPPAFRQRFGVTLTGEQTQQLLAHHRAPSDELLDKDEIARIQADYGFTDEQMQQELAKYRPRNFDLRDAALMAQLQAAYDAEIAWLDDEVGKLLAALPANTLVVIFSDHGEAFEEHGWMGHGATLHEEEIRVVLLMRPPAARAGQRCDAPVMLLDVAPTILRQCGVQPPAIWEGRDLSPAFAALALPPRPQYSETTRVLEGLVLRGVTLDGQRGLASLWQHPRKYLYERLAGEPPGAPSDLAAGGPVKSFDELVRTLEAYASEGSFWLVGVGGFAHLRLNLTVTEGRVALAAPIAPDWDSDALRLSEDGRTLTWDCAPGLQEGLYLQTSVPVASITLAATTDGEPSLVYLAGPQPDEWRRAEAPTTAITPDAARAALSVATLLRNDPGVYVSYHAGTYRPPAGAPANLDAETLRQLRALGYAH